MTFAAPSTAVRGSVCRMPCDRTAACHGDSEGLGRVRLSCILEVDSHAPLIGASTLDSKNLFEVLVREHIGPVRAFLLSTVRNAAIAEDLVQEAFLVAWANLDRYDRKLPFGPWVRGIASRLAWNHRRKQSRSKVAYVESEDLQALEQQFERLDQTTGDTFEEKVNALRSGLTRLTELQRQVIDLHYEHEMPCAQIATRLGLGLEAVKKHLQRGRAALLREMETRMSSMPQLMRKEA